MAAANTSVEIPMRRSRRIPVEGLFLGGSALVLVILVDSVRVWLAILRKRKVPILNESEYVISALTAE